MCIPSNYAVSMNILSFLLLNNIEWIRSSLRILKFFSIIIWCLFVLLILLDKSNYGNYIRLFWSNLLNFDLYTISSYVGNIWIFLIFSLSLSNLSNLIILLPFYGIFFSYLLSFRNDNISFLISSLVNKLVASSI